MNMHLKVKIFKAFFRMFRRQESLEQRIQKAVYSEIEKIHQESRQRSQLTAKIASLPSDVLAQCSKEM
ncbi:TPA: hypothetical protein MIM88_22780 [Klebsiella pneumoniae]|nr:hypothetical protein [Klebsiella pneumoniae]